LAENSGGPVGVHEEPVKEGRTKSMLVVEIKCRKRRKRRKEKEEKKKKKKPRKASCFNYAILLFRLMLSNMRVCFTFTARILVGTNSRHFSFTFVTIFVTIERFLFYKNISFIK